MSILDKMIIKDLFKTMLAILSIIVVIIVSRKFIRILAKAIDGQLSVDAVMGMLGYKIIVVSTLFLPAAVFMAVLMVLGRMYRVSPRFSRKLFINLTRSLLDGTKEGKNWATMRQPATFGGIKTEKERGIVPCSAILKGMSSDFAALRCDSSRNVGGVADCNAIVAVARYQP